MRILIGADIVPTPSNFSVFSEANAEILLKGGLREQLSEADFRVFNLEVPLADAKTPIEKYGEALLAPRATVAGLRAIGVDLVTLANNHILDHGAEGLYSTMELLDTVGIAHCGAGKTPEAAAEPWILEKDGKKVGFYCCAEHEFSIVTQSTPGANPFDPLWSLDHIRQLKARCDCVVVLYHGGKEHYRYPSPMLQKVCRRMVEVGADLVICQHTHCIGSQEQYAGGTIVYGQGNFLFDEEDNEFWSTSLLVALNDDGGKWQVEYIPLCKAGAAVSAAGRQDAIQIMEDFRIRSQQIQEPGFVEKNYADFAREELHSCYGKVMGRYVFFLYRVLNKLSGGRLRWRWYGKADALALINLLECEPHREVFATGLREMLAHK